MNEFRFQIENQINPNLLTSVSIQNFPGLKGKLPKFISNKSTNIETLVLKGVQLGTRIVKDNNTDFLVQVFNNDGTTNHSAAGQSEVIVLGTFVQKNVLCHLTKLQLLDLSSNGIGEMPNCLRNLKNLHTVNLQINVLPIVRHCNGSKYVETYNFDFFKSVLSIKNIRYLDVSINELGKLEGKKEVDAFQEYLPKATALEQLRLDHNYFDNASFPNISSLLNLKELVIYPMYTGRSGFQYLPDSVCNINFTKQTCYIGPAAKTLSCYKKLASMCFVEIDQKAGNFGRQGHKDGHICMDHQMFLEKY